MDESRSQWKTKKIKMGEKLFKSKYYYDIKNQFKEKVINRDNETIDFLKGILKANKVEATRKSSQNSLKFFSKKINNFIGGSADLTGSNLTKTKYSKIDKNQFNYISLWNKRAFNGSCNEWNSGAQRIYTIWRNIFSFLRLL